MEELGLIGLRVQRMPNEPDLEFGIPSQYGYMTVSQLCTLTHLPWNSYYWKSQTLSGQYHKLYNTILEFSR